MQSKCAVPRRFLSHVLYEYGHRQCDQRDVPRCISNDEFSSSELLPSYQRRDEVLRLRQADDICRSFMHGTCSPDEHDDSAADDHDDGPADDHDDAADVAAARQ